MNLLESLMDEFLHITREETVEKFVVKNARLQSFIGEFNQSDIVKVIRVQPEKERIKLAIQSLMVVSGKKGFSDREVQKILSAGAPGRRRNGRYPAVSGGLE